MPGDGKSELRRVLSEAIADFVGGRDILEEAAAFVASPEFAPQLDEAYKAVLAAIGGELVKDQRVDPLHRLLAHRFSDAFKAGSLSRSVLPNFFSFIHLVLGDQMAALSGRAAAIVEELHAGQSGPLDWDRFHQDRGVDEILWVVLVRIAETFRRFDARKEWFVDLMGYNPQAVSLASHAFVPRASNETPPPFGPKEFNIMFSCLFGPMRHLSETQRQRFQADFGRTPEVQFGTLLANLKASGGLV